MLANLRRSLQPQIIFPSLTVGVVTGIQNAILALAFAVMIFGGELNSFISIGISVLFAGCLLQSIVVALGSSLPGMMTITQDSPAVIMALVVSAIAAAMPGASPEAKFYTALAGIMITTLLSGAACLLLGKFRLGSLVSYLPYPVISGFLAGTGMLLVLGAFQVMTGRNVTLLTLAPLFQNGAWWLWLPGVVFAVVLFWLVIKVRHYLVLPGVLIVAMVIFYLILWGTGTSVAAASQTGWLVSGLPKGEALFRWWDPAGFALVEWNAILRQSGEILACIVISLLSLLLNITAIGLSTDQEIDLDVELTNNGWANLLSGATGSIIGYPLLGSTSLAYRLGAKIRLNGIIVAAIIGLALFFGGSFLGYFPNLILGGLLFFIGLDFLYSWLYETWASMPRIDYAIMVTIALLINTIGFLEGVGVGLGLAIILFVIQYSRVPSIRHVLSSISYQSNVDRPRLHTQLLRRKGNWLYILELQGFIFFGTANKILEQIRHYLETEAAAHPPRYLLLDFRLVTGADSSAGFSFARLMRLTEARDIKLILTSVSAQIRKQFIKQLPSKSVSYFSDLDHGMEWCGNEMLSVFESVGMTIQSGSLFKELLKAMPTPADVEILRQCLRARETQPGECIIRQGQPPAGLYMIESGQVSILLECEDGSRLRLRTLGNGAFFGEIGLYTREPATAWAIADRRTSLYQLSTEDLDRLEETAPQVASALHRFVVTYMSERLAKMTNTVQALMH
ncbi:MAG: SLC26A/SulP transporter family protein [Anaerolineales bacterium]|nr:SLC26A/SulP transporter family protein [Anaerolineales bacterium]